MEQILLISNSDDPAWHSKLEAELNSYGRLQVKSQEDAVESIRKNNYLITLIDAFAVEDFAFLVSRIRALKPDSRIIVITAIPNWKDAREAFQSGAADYVYKSSAREEFFSSLAMTLAKPAPPWPR